MKTRGFTLIEILVVVSIIGVLSSVILTSVSKARLKAENSTINQQVEQYVKALQMIYLENGNYPITTPTPVSLGKVAETIQFPIFNGIDAQFDTKLKQYIPSLPTIKLGASYNAKDSGKSASINWYVNRIGLGTNWGGAGLTTGNVCQGNGGYTLYGWTSVLCWRDLNGIDQKYYSDPTSN